MENEGPALEVEDLAAGYGDVRSLNGVSLHVATGEVVALLGANGAGKTSTLRAISGTISRHEGTVRFDGRAIEAMSAHKRVRLGIGHVPEGRQIFGPLTVRENLEIGAVSSRRKDRSIADAYSLVYDLFPVLHERGDQLGGTLSGGEQQMLAIARALMGSPSFLMLDEPSLGLAPLVVESIFDTLSTLNQTGLTILLVEQNAEVALELAHRAYVIELGKIVHEGTPEGLRASSALGEIYFGMSTATTR